MKKIVLTFVTLVAFTFANAQEATTDGAGFNSGDVFISGAVAFGSESTGDFKTNAFTFSPRVGFFVNPNIAVGLALGYTSSTSDEYNSFYEDIVERKVSAFEIGAFGRYYFTPASKFSIFGELGVGYVTAKSELNVPGSGESKVNGFAVALAPGINYFVSNNFSLEATFGILGYTTMKPDADNAESTDTFSFGLNTQDISLGLVYKF